MKRTALYIGFPYTAGLLLASVVEVQLFVTVCSTVAFAALLAVFLRKDVYKYVLIGTLSFMTACCVYWWQDAGSVKSQTAFAGQADTVFTGTITSIAAYDSGYAGYMLEGELNGEVKAKLLYTCENAGYAYGDTLTVKGTPQQMTSGYLFDTASYYRSENVHLRMFYADSTEHIPRAHDTLRSILYEWRQEMTERILSRADSQSGAAMVGMLFGDKSALEGSTKTALYRVGIGHVLAVSGLHLDFLALFVARLLRKCGADRRLSFGVMAVLAILFVICVGETVSIKRACIMILLSQSAGLFFRKADVLNSLSIAMLLLGLENPFVVHSAAFWLSVAGTFGIGVFAPYMTEKIPDKNPAWKFWRHAAAMFCVFFVVFPFTVLYFRDASLISPLSNLVLVPLCMLAFMLTAVSLLFGARGIAAELLLMAAENITDVVRYVSEWLAGLPYTHIGTGSRILLFVLCGAAAAAVLCHLFCRSRRMLCAMLAGSVLVTAGAVSFEQYYSAGNIRISVLGDERDCVLVIGYGKEAVVIDLCGDAQAPSYVQACLESGGMERVTALVLCDAEAVRMEDYESALYFYPPEEVAAMEPEDDEPSAFAMNFHGAAISVEEDTAVIRYGGMQYRCCREARADRPCEVLTVYGTSRNTLPDSGILMVLDERSCYASDSRTYVGENNLELIIAGNGDCRVRRLYADT